MNAPLFELHLTVCAEDDAALARFRAFCAERSVGCTVIELARGETRRQPMTSTRHALPLEWVRREAWALARALEAAGFAVLRMKIESHPESPGVPTTDAEARLQPAGHYFEHHVKVALPAGEGLERLVSTCVSQGAHVSSTPRRVRPDGSQVYFGNTRYRSVGWSTALARRHTLIQALTSEHFQVLEVESEYALVDTNADLDRGWLPS